MLDKSHTPAPWEGGSVATPQHIASMALTHDPLEIADRLGISEAQVVKILAKQGKLANGRLIGVCERSGRRVAGFSERSVYIKAQIAGFAYWHFEREQPGEHQATHNPVTAAKVKLTGAPKTDQYELRRMLRDGASLQQIADKLGITHGAAKKRVAAARRRGELDNLQEA